MNETGREGERIAAAWLERQGMRVLARNWRSGRLELDLVVQDGASIAFVEVKTRRLGPGGSPSDAVDRAKRGRLARAAGAWIAGNPCRVAEFRFDVVEIILAPGGDPLVEHWIDAFRAGF